MATAYQINHINCHATSTPQGDAVESKAVALAFPHCSHLLLSSSKGNIGHLLGAAGAVVLPSLSLFALCFFCSLFFYSSCFLLPAERCRRAVEALALSLTRSLSFDCCRRAVEAAIAVLLLSSRPYTLVAQDRMH